MFGWVVRKCSGSLCRNVPCWAVITALLCRSPVPLPHPFTSICKHMQPALPKMKDLQKNAKNIKLQKLHNDISTYGLYSWGLCESNQCTKSAHIQHTIKHKYNKTSRQQRRWPMQLHCCYYCYLVRIYSSVSKKMFRGAQVFVRVLFLYLCLCSRALLVFLCLLGSCLHSTSVHANMMMLIEDFRTIYIYMHMYSEMQTYT